MDNYDGWAADKASPVDKYKQAGICDTYTVICRPTDKEFSPKTGVNFGENKVKINIWDVLTRKPAWLTGFLLFCVQIDNGDLLYVV